MWKMIGQCNWIAASLVAACGLGAAQVALADALIDPALGEFTQGRGTAPTVRVIALLPAQLPGLAVPRRYDRTNVLGYLQEVAAANTRAMDSYLRSTHALGTAIRPYHMYWINSSFAADVTVEGLRLLARAPGVTKIYADRAVNREPTLRGPLTRPPGLMAGEPGTYAAKDTGLDRLRIEDPRHNGNGIVIGSVDTGVDGKHPALAGKIVAFYDAQAKRRTDPIDRDEHGTHTAGTMVGGDGSQVTIGVAPGARLIATAALTGYADMLAGMEFMLDPDGDPKTNDSPRAINNSWNCGGAPDIELFYRAIGAWEAAGILPVFSAGNSGPRPRTITPPHEHPATFAIGATGENGKIASFSSRGPGVFHGQETQKPDITAPGDNIRSSLPNNRYGQMSGTSMATPHVTGATALVWQANPTLTPLQMRKILVASSLPVDENGQPGKAGNWNATYGFGRLNIYNAVHLAMETARAHLLGRPMLGTATIAGFELPGWLDGPSEQEVSSVLEDTVEPMTSVTEFPASGTDESAWLRAEAVH